MSINKYKNYSLRLQNALQHSPWDKIDLLTNDLIECVIKRKNVYICGNGGSAANAIHIANDFIYGIAKKTGRGLKIQALTSNTAVITCLANDVGYDSIFSEQLAVFGEASDILIVLSGSGNSPNILEVLNQAKLMNIKSYAILGYDGGKAKNIADELIHFDIDDMQIAEDLQLIIGHMIMQTIYNDLK
jgi:D-sedoheptulose 7-phosphate isomerase